jgi:glyoxylase I family protein
MKRPMGDKMMATSMTCDGYLGTRRKPMVDEQTSSTVGDVQPKSTTRFHGVRYQVTDVRRSVAFYTKHLGFRLEHQEPPAFANVSLGDLHLLLSGPGASGSRAMPDGRRQEAGGWNRIVLRVPDLPSYIDALKEAGVPFRNQMEVGPGGRQIQIEDPDGHSVELFEPGR